ncbi:MAG: hypothetical protein ACXADH_15485 [Candidatus Kariarchaeaceae archaeon]|jgi:hypothetical protein
MMFEPDKELIGLADNVSVAVQRAENFIKDKITKLCRERNLKFSCYISTFWDQEGNEIEDDQTLEIDDYLDWFEHNIAQFDPQSHCDKGIWN